MYRYSRTLQKLKSFDLAGTQISVFPKEILQLSKLDTLDIGGTPLQEDHLFKYESNQKLVQDFLTSLFKEKEPIVGIYKDLESRDSEKIQAALQQLENNPNLKKQAEKRYLPFIQARTNNSMASLSQFEEVVLSEVEEHFLLSKNVIGDSYLSFQMMEDSKTKLIVDFLGAMIKGVFDVDDYCNKCYLCTTRKGLIKRANKNFLIAKTAIFEESTVYTKGWFGKIYFAFAKARIGDVLFENTNFKKANNSLVLKEYYFFLNSFKNKRELTFDIFQSDIPDLTELFWLTSYVPETKWGDTELTLPASPLFFSRKARVREGDFNNWEEVESSFINKKPYH